MCIRKSVRISWVIERWRSDKQARDVRGQCYCIDSFKSFRLQQDKIIANEWNHQEIRTIKNNLRLKSPKI